MSTAPKHRGWSYRPAVVAIAIGVSLAGCRNREEELAREIAAYAPRIDEVRGRIATVRALVPASAAEGPDLAPLDPPLDLVSGLANAIVVDDQDLAPRVDAVQPAGPWSAGSYSAVGCLKTTSIDHRDLAMSDGNAVRRFCDQAVALKYVVIVRDVFRRRAEVAESGALVTGVVVADVFVTRLDPPSLAAAFTVQAASSWRVDYRYSRNVHGADRASAIDSAAGDLQRNAMLAVHGALARSGAQVDTEDDPAAAWFAPVPSRVVPEGYKRGGRSPASFVVPIDWQWSAPDSEFVVADYEVRSPDRRLRGQLLVRWNQNDVESFDRWSETLVAEFTAQGVLRATRGTRRDAGGRGWYTFEGVRPATDTRPSIHFLAQATPTLDGESVHSVECTWPEGLESGGASACPTILESFTAHD